jgi:uncharacterized membrane protein YecN with MAPEG domain
MQAMDVLTITLTITGAAALINIWLSIRVSHLRRLHKVSIGDGGNEGVRTRMRAHANYAEITPIFLILLALVELARGTSDLLWVAGILFILARLAHPFGMERPAPNLLRIASVLVSWIVLLALALYALSIPYTEPRLDESIAAAGSAQAAG